MVVTELTQAIKPLSRLEKLGISSKAGRLYREPQYFVVVNNS